MPNVWKLYFKCAAVFVPSFFLFFGLAPTLISSLDSLAVFIGLAIVLLVPPGAYMLFRLFRMQHNLAELYKSAKAHAERHVGSSPPPPPTVPPPTVSRSEALRRAGRTNSKFVSALPLLMLMSVTPLMGGCGVVEYWSVPAGNVLVVVNKYGSDKGLDNAEVRGPGRYWLTYNQEGHLFPTFTQNYTWTKDCDASGDCTDESISFQTREGLTVNTDVGISYEVKADKAHVVFAKYRRGVDEITDIYLRNMVRDALVQEGSRLAVEAVYGSGKTDLMARVEDQVRMLVADLGIHVENIYWIGEARLPDKVIEALNAKIEATQKAQQRENEIQQTKAEAQKAIEEARGLAESVRLRAEAEAAANDLVSKSLTPELVRYRALDKWNGELPRINGAGAVPFVDVSGEAKKQ